MTTKLKLIRSLWGVTIMGFFYGVHAFGISLYLNDAVFLSIAFAFLITFVFFRTLLNKSLKLQASAGVSRYFRLILSTSINWVLESRLRAFCICCRALLTLPSLFVLSGIRAWITRTRDIANVAASFRTLPRIPALAIECLVASVLLFVGFHTWFDFLETPMFVFLVLTTPMNLLFVVWFGERLREDQNLSMWRPGVAALFSFSCVYVAILLIEVKVLSPDTHGEDLVRQLLRSAQSIPSITSYILSLLQGSSASQTMSSAFAWQIYVDTLKIFAPLVFIGHSIQYFIKPRSEKSVNEEALLLLQQGRSEDARECLARLKTPSELTNFVGASSSAALDDPQEAFNQLDYFGKRSFFASFDLAPNEHRVFIFHRFLALSPTPDTAKLLRSAYLANYFDEPIYALCNDLVCSYFYSNVQAKGSAADRSTYEKILGPLLTSFGYLNALGDQRINRYLDARSEDGKFSEFVEAFRTGEVSDFEASAQLFRLLISIRSFEAASSEVRRVMTREYRTSLSAHFELLFQAYSRTDITRLTLGELLVRTLVVQAMQTSPGIEIRNSCNENLEGHKKLVEVINEHFTSSRYRFNALGLPKRL